MRHGDTARHVRRDRQSVIVQFDTTLSTDEPGHLKIRPGRYLQIIVDAPIDTRFTTNDPTIAGITGRNKAAGQQIIGLNRSPVCIIEARR